MEGRVIGATQYKTKPFDWEDLLKTVGECLH